MEKEYQSELRKISFVSFLLLLMLGAAAVLVVAAVIYFYYLVLSSPTASVASVTETLGLFSYDLKDLRAGLLNTGDKIVLLTAISVLAVLAETFLVRGAQLMQCFRTHRLFSDSSVRIAESLARLYVVFLAVSVVYSVILPLFMSLPRLPFAVDADRLFVLGLLWVFVWMLQVGRALQLDSELAI